MVGVHVVNIEGLVDLAVLQTCANVFAGATALVASVVARSEESGRRGEHYRIAGNERHRILAEGDEAGLAQTFCRATDADHVVIGEGLDQPASHGGGMIFEIL